MSPSYRSGPLRAVVLLAVLAAASCAAPSGSGPSPRPVVLILHGRGLLSLDSARVRTDWLLALNHGIASVDLETTLTQDDVRLVWYADALDPASPAECRAGTPGDADAGPREEVESVMGAIGTLMGAAAEWTGEAGGPGLRSLAADLLYFGVEERRCAAEERLASAMDRAEREGRPVVLVAHSFGSFLAWRHLHVRQGGPAVERLVTIGSLLGLPEVRAFLFGPGMRGPGLPPGVRSWVNVRDPKDPLSAPLVDVQGTGEDDAAIDDRTTERPAVGSVHPAERYLEDPATGRAVLEGWCAASLSPGRGSAAPCPEPGRRP